MKLDIRPGRYVVAVSGGVDSMVLLDLIVKLQKLDLLVVHFDHGIRPDSAVDCRFVAQAAKKYGLEFVYGTAQLGPRASEEQARNARYTFLRSEARKFKASAIITAHHQDDMIETALLNMIRGTGRKGLTSIASATDILRPLLTVSKDQIIDYAKANKINWREDPTNEDTDYFRNYIRKELVPKMSVAERKKLVELLASLTVTNREIDDEIANYLHFSNKKLNVMNRNLLISLSHNIACEALAEWLRKNNIREFDKNSIERLVIAVKTYKSGQKAAIVKGKYLSIGKRTVEII